MGEEGREGEGGGEATTSVQWKCFDLIRWEWETLTASEGGKEEGKEGGKEGGVEGGREE